MFYLLYIVMGVEGGVELIFSRCVVHMADFDFLGDGHASWHELSHILKEKGPV